MPLALPLLYAMQYIYKNHIYLFVAGITLAFGALGLCCPVFLQKTQYPLLIVLVMLIGLPHGATDFLLFRHLRGPVLSRKQVLQFFLFYLMAVSGYLVFWFLWPIPALLLFLLISMYHFGQSNHQNTKMPRWASTLLNMAWGAFALGGAVLWHLEERSVVIRKLVGTLPASWSSSSMGNLQWCLLLVNVFLLICLWLARRLNGRQLLFEVGNLAVLSFMFLCTPMLVGFTLYFTLWHSLGSLLDQLAFYRRQWPAFTLAHYYRQAAPYTLLAVVGLLGMAFGQSLLFPNTSLISLFLIFIACITLPHILLVEEIYR